MIQSIPFKFDRDDERALAAELGEDINDVKYMSLVNMAQFCKDVVRANLDNLKAVHGIGEKEPKLKIKVRRRSR